MKFLGINTFKDLVDKPQKIIESDIKAYLVYLRTKKKIPYRSAASYLFAVRKFYYVNSDYQFKWDLINKYLGNDDTDTAAEDDIIDNDDDELQDQEEDRPYTKEEIKIMFNAAQEIRVKIIISLLSSSGLRHGALPILKLRDLEKIEKYNLYKITAYRNSKKFKYNTFCTPECTALIDSYLEYRKKQGEQLKGNSPLIREQFNTTDKLKINNPRQLTPRGIRFMINDVLTKYTNLRKKLKFDHENKRKQGRNPTMLTHAFRKFFSTECAKAEVYPDYIELMLGHKLPGMRSHYNKPDINILLEGTKEVKGYVAAINDHLTINDENRLTKQVQELKEQDDYHKYVIDKKIKEKDEEI
jgi:integrase